MDEDIPENNDDEECTDEQYVELKDDEENYEEIYDNYDNYEDINGVYVSPKHFHDNDSNNNSNNDSNDSDNRRPFSELYDKPVHLGFKQTDLTSDYYEPTPNDRKSILYDLPEVRFLLSIGYDRIYLHIHH